MLTDKQKLEREASLGSSDAPIVAGVSPYCSALELYYKLHGELPRYSDDDSEAMEWGNRLEAVVAAAFAEKTGAKIRRIGTVRHKRHPFICANLDYEIVGSEKGPGVLEIKTRDRGDLARWDGSGIPDDISLQVAHQLAASNREWAKVAVLFGGQQFRIYEVQRDKEIEEYLIELEARFMLRVSKGEPPDHTWTPETVGMLKKLYPTDSGQTIELPDRALTLIGQFRQAKDDLDEVETQKAEAEGALKSMMGDASLATVPGWQVSWKSTKASRKFDADRFEQEQPALYAEYQKIVPGYRRFSIKPSKELAS